MAQSAAEHVFDKFYQLDQFLFAVVGQCLCSPTLGSDMSVKDNSYYYEKLGPTPVGIKFKDLYRLLTKGNFALVYRNMRCILF